MTALKPFLSKTDDAVGYLKVSGQMIACIPDEASPNPVTCRGASLLPKPRMRFEQTPQRVLIMALPLAPGLTPAEIAFLCEMELVTVIPRQRLGGLDLLGVCAPRTPRYAPRLLLRVVRTKTATYIVSRVQ